MQNTICIENHRVGNDDEVVIDYLDANDADQSSDGMIETDDEGPPRKVDKLTVEKQASGLISKWIVNDHFK